MSKSRGLPMRTCAGVSVEKSTGRFTIRGIFEGLRATGSRGGTMQSWLLRREGVGGDAAQQQWKWKAKEAEAIQICGELQY